MCNILLSIMDQWNLSLRFHFILTIRWWQNGIHIYVAVEVEVEEEEKRCPLCKNCLLHYITLHSMWCDDFTGMRTIIVILTLCLRVESQIFFLPACFPLYYFIKNRPRDSQSKFYFMYGNCASNDINFTLSFCCFFRYFLYACERRCTVQAEIKNGTCSMNTKQKIK